MVRRGWSIAAFTGLSLLLVGCLARAEDWPRFRGPNGTGISTSSNLPDELDVEKNVLWKVDCGQGTSSPVAIHGRLFVTSFDGDTRTVHCLDALTGKSLWAQSLQKVRDENASRPNGPATCTPAANEECVVAFLPDTALVCFSADGQQRWRVEVGPFHSMHGIAGSPVIAEQKVLLQVDQLRGSFLAAYDLATGELSWKVERLDGLTGAYSTPSILASPEGALAVASGPQELIAYRVQNGKKVWSVPGVTNAPVSVPTIAAKQLFVCEPVGAVEPISMLAQLDKNQDGKFALEEVKANVPIYRLLGGIDTKYGNSDGVVDSAEWERSFGGIVDKGGLVAIGLDPSSDNSPPKVLWTYRKTVPYVSSVLALNEVVYFVQDGGIVTTVDAANGDVLKRGRLKTGGRRFYSSPIAADGKVYLVTTGGQVTVLKADGQWEVLSTSSLGESCFATPAIADGNIYVRTLSKLYCFGKSG